VFCFVFVFVFVLFLFFVCSRDELFEEGDGVMIRASTLIIYGSESWDKEGIVDKFDRFDPSCKSCLLAASHELSQAC
jgi:hypothetical protein